MLLRMTALVAAFAVVMGSGLGVEAAQPTATGAITVEWDPNPESNIAGYIVYVGETPNAYQQSFDVGINTTFTFTAVPGHRYHFAVAAYADSRVEGPLSNEVSAEIAGSDTSAREAARCAATRDCAAGAIVAHGLAQIDALVALDDGRLLAIEGGHAIRVIAPGGVQPSPAVEEASHIVRLHGLAVDPAFDRTHFVFVGHLEHRPDGERAFTVVRYRELNGLLGEAAAIVTALPLSGEADPSLAVDGEGRLYVAMPGGGGRDSYAAKVLRFNPDGTASGAREGSPVLSWGYQRPAAIAWDGAMMWNVGAGDGQAGTSVVASMLGADAVDALVRSAAVNGARGVRAFAARRVGADGGRSAFAWLDEEGRLERVSVGADMRREPLGGVLFEGARPTALAIGAGGECYAAVPDRSGAFTVLKLADQSGKF